MSGAAALLELRRGPGFVLPDAWDPGPARLLDGVVGDADLQQRFAR